MQRALISGAEAGQAAVICLVIHGRGQQPEDMVGMVTRHIDVPGVRYVIPRAPGASWYDARAIDPLNERTRAQMGAGLEMVHAMATEALSVAPAARNVLAGFSQGACMSADYLMRHGPLDGGACLFTGCRVGSRADAPPVRSLAGMAVYTSCGDNDPWIPAPAWHDLIADLTRAGARLRADLFPGRPHMVTGTEIAALTDMLAEAAARAR